MASLRPYTPPSGSLYAGDLRVSRTLCEIYPVSLRMISSLVIHLFTFFDSLGSPIAGARTIRFTANQGAGHQKARPRAGELSFFGLPKND